MQTVSKWVIYEQEKKKIKALNLDWISYQIEIKKLIERLKI